MSKPKLADNLLFAVWVAYLLATTLFLPLVCPYKSFSLWFGWIPTFLGWAWLWVLIMAVGTVIHVYIHEISKKRSESRQKQTKEA